MNLVWLDISASYSHSSLALPAIEACREGDDGYEWSCVSGTINSDLFALTRELYEAQPTIIAATLWLFNHDVVLSICQRIKALVPHVEIILGGAEFDGCNESFLRRNTFINKVFRGEGEVEFHRLLRGEKLSSIVGLCYLDSEGRYCDNGAARVANFAQLPPPESSRFFSLCAPFVQMEFSRGCFNDCAFCVSGGDKPIRDRSIEQARERIADIAARGIRDVRVLDRTFNYSPRRAKELLAMFCDFPSMNFHLEIHPALLTDSLCDALSAMPNGLLHLEAGMQSLDDRVIESSGRIGANEAAIRGLARLCEMSNFETHADLIAGLPHYTLSQIFRDVRQLVQLGADEIQLELLKLLPGTRMRRQAAELGICYSSQPPYEVLQTPVITVAELDRARQLSKLIDKFYNAKAWQQPMKMLIEADDRFLERFLEYLLPMELLDRPLSLDRRGALLFAFCCDCVGAEYADMVSIAWIESGLSLRRAEAGMVEKLTLPPPYIDAKPGQHYYLWQGANQSYIFIFDRSLDHSRPISKVALS
ncbi:MAG: DUF4080 domain-containing protein [Rikenellaceae bacterium]